MRCGEGGEGQSPSYLQAEEAAFVGSGVRTFWWSALPRGVISVLESAGCKTADLALEHVIPEATFSNWKAKFGAGHAAEAGRGRLEMAASSLRPPSPYRMKSTAEREAGPATLIAKSATPSPLRSP